MSDSDSSDSNEIVGIEASEIKNYVIVEFHDGLQLIPRNWIAVDKSIAYFPDITKINSKQFDKLVLNTEQPHSSWETFEIKKIWASSDDFIRGKQKLRIALTLSETEDINSDRDELISKHKRRLLAAKKPKHTRKITIDKKKQTPKKYTTSSIPPLPKPFFNQSGNKSPYQSPSKNSTLIDQNALDDLNFKYHEPSNPVIKIQSNIEISPLKLCNNHRQMRQLQNDSVKNTGYQFSQGPLGMDMSSSPLFMSSSSKVKPVSNSTPKFKPNNSGVIRELFIDSPITTPKKITSNRKNSNFTISTLIELNVKLNKVILNQARQQQMLEKICKQLKPNNDESMCDDDDVILEGFPIDSLARLNEVNMTLKTDKSYLKKLIKKLRQFHGPSVSLVTKSIMNLLFTNHFGCKMSLTGRGALNKKDKEPLKTTLLFKIISGVILKNVKGASVTSINKAVTGWLKHAKERYERHIKQNSDP
ncbi:uncharacterized protein LOC126550899 isoform X2 [Aphis gossypii]|uniref:uncharacterized protein LOC126550899 isoform X2 n=1 Tax=Aphis gossypii TaxID=80765 RepID=UPI002159AA21|nr:uncharacterized protein LOC126550899 isoform X2 [Aphis gossypii]